MPDGSVAETDRTVVLPVTGLGVAAAACVIDRADVARRGLAQVEHGHRVGRERIAEGRPVHGESGREVGQGGRAVGGLALGGVLGLAVLPDRGLGRRAGNSASWNWPVSALVAFLLITSRSRWPLASSTA